MGVNLPNIWSRYSGSTPCWLAFSSGQTALDRSRIADVVLLIKRETSYVMGAWGRSVPQYKAPKASDRVVRVVRNTTWDSTVGKEISVSKAEWDTLSIYAEDAPDILRRQWGVNEMVCLVRS